MPRTLQKNLGIFKWEQEAQGPGPEYKELRFLSGQSPYLTKSNLALSFKQELSFMAPALYIQYRPILNKLFSPTLHQPKRLQWLRDVSGSSVPGFS